MKQKIADVALARLSLYSRYLKMMMVNGKSRVLSEDIAQYYNFDAAQVRKDLSYLGKLGTRGYGYNCQNLYDCIVAQLGREVSIDVVVVGVGKLGTALIGYRSFRELGFNIVAGFDNNVDKIKTQVNNVIVHHSDTLKTYIAENNIGMAVITVPDRSAREVARVLFDTKIGGIINFAPVYLASTKTCFVRNIDLSVEFEVLRYNQLKSREKKG